MSNPLRNSELHKAAASNNVHQMESLMKYGLTPKLKNVVGETALHTAARMGQSEALSFLIHEGAELEAKDDQQQTPLHKAAERGFEWGVRKLVDFECEINAHDAQGHTPLHLAANAEGSREIIRYLILNDAKVNARNKDGDTPLMIAAMNGRLSNVEALIEFHAGCFLENLMGMTALHLAAKHGQTNVLQKLGKLMVDRPLSHNGYTALELASGNVPGSFKAVLQLLDLGADPNMVSGRKSYPLHRAALEGNVSTAELLVRAGANVNNVDARGETAIFSAVALYRIDMVKFLIKSGTDLSEPNTKGQLAAFSALGNEEILRLLITDRPEDMAHISGCGRNLLHEAFARNLEGSALLLLELGACTLAPSWGDEGRTARELSPQQTSKAYRLLLEKMALQQEGRERSPAGDTTEEE